MKFAKEFQLIHRRFKYTHSKIAEINETTKAGATFNVKV
jgi:hypothetical protein